MTNATATTATEIKPFFNQIGWSDVQPFEVVRIVSDKTVEIRSMKATLAEDWKPEFVVGGFAGQAVNQNTQRWNIESDDNGRVYRIRLTKSGWKMGSVKFRMADAPRKFYDYNF
jgi:hypothetical protein